MIEKEEPQFETKKWLNKKIEKVFRKAKIKNFRNKNFRNSYIFSFVLVCAF